MSIVIGLFVSFGLAFLTLLQKFWLKLIVCINLLNPGYESDPRSTFYLEKISGDDCGGEGKEGNWLELANLENRIAKPVTWSVAKGLVELVSCDSVASSSCSCSLPGDSRPTSSATVAPQYRQECERGQSPL